MSRPFNFVYLLLFLSMLLPACKPSCVPEEDVREPLSPALLDLVPYQDGNHYQFRHSAGKIIDFLAVRDTVKESHSFFDDCKSVTYYVSNVFLNPQYPLFQIHMRVSNQYSEGGEFQINIGRISFYMPGADSLYHHYDYRDSVRLQDRTYYNVFCLQGSSGYPPGDGLIHVDSLYFNKKQGVIRIKMSNEETFTRYE